MPHRQLKNIGFHVIAVFDKSENRQNALRALADFYIKDFTKAEEILL
jgi:hypothetical protein